MLKISFKILHLNMQCNIARMVVWGGLVSKLSVPDAAGKCPIMFEESVREGEKGKWGLSNRSRGDLYSGTHDHYQPWES